MEQSESTYGSTASVQSTPVHAAVRLPYLPGLDGLRALAVIAVLLYHAGLSVSGGYLGVESFFVLSGFLITALLLAEWRQHGRIRLVAFWGRRVRRLLPALVLVLAATLTLAGIWLPEERANVRIDTLAALGYVMNWHLIASQQSYFDPLVRPPLLQHLWSLAIEEQFYLFWPIVFAVGMRYLRRRGLLVALVIAAGASAALMAARFDPGADPSRVYYGTDTRASAILLGSALALIWAPWRRAATARLAAGLALDVTGLVALAALLVSYVRLFEFHPLLYRGGFLAVSVLTAIVIVACTYPRSRLLPALLGAFPLRWIGLRSYGIYLWHWPIFMVTRPFVDVPWDGWQWQVVRFAVVFGVADVSYRLVERPIRRGALVPLWRMLGRLPAFVHTARHWVNQNDTLNVYASAGEAPNARPTPVPIEAESQPLSGRKPATRRQYRTSSARRRHLRRRTI